MKVYNIILLLVALNFISSIFNPVFSQSSIEEPLIMSYSKNTIFSPVSDGSEFFKNKIEIVTESDGSSAISAKISGKRITGIINQNFNIEIKAPLEKGKEFTTRADIDGLIGTTSIKLNYNFSSFNKWLSIDSNELKSKCKDNLTLLDFGKLSDCNSKNNNDVFEKLEIPIWYGGFSAELGYKSYEFLNKDSLDSTSKSFQPWSVGIFFNRLIYNKYVISFEYDYQKVYKAKDDVIRCPVAEEMFHCVSGANGEPNKQTNQLLSLSYKSAESTGDNYAIIPKITHNFETHATQISVPYYFILDNNNNLTGGIKADWDNIEHEWIVGFFVGYTLGES